MECLNQLNFESPDKYPEGFCSSVFHKLGKADVVILRNQEV